MQLRLSHRRQVGGIVEGESISCPRFSFPGIRIQYTSVLPAEGTHASRPRNSNAKCGGASSQVGFIIDHHACGALQVAGAVWSHFRTVRNLGLDPGSEPVAA